MDNQNPNNATPATTWLTLFLRAELAPDGVTIARWKIFDTRFDDVDATEKVREGMDEQRKNEPVMLRVVTIQVATADVTDLPARGEAAEFLIRNAIMKSLGPKSPQLPLF